MEKIIIHNTNNSSYIKDAKILNGGIECGYHFNAFVENQKKGPKTDGSYKKKGLSSDGAARLREETTGILSHCNPQNAVSNIETTHLVVGYVQSGKTMSFTGLTALALDNGYRIIVYLAGSKKNLLNQTSKRLEKDLIGKNGQNRDFYKLHKDPTGEDADQIVGHLELSNQPLLLIPILKHHKHIDNLTKIFKSNDFKEATENKTVLIVDDEADQASLNSYGRKNSKKETDVEEEESKTYASILKMRASLPGNTYIQYTATPQANLLISMQDLLSPKSHTLLTPGDGYIGGKLYFGQGSNHDLFNGALIKTIPENEVFHKKRNKLTTPPNSLKDALILHILAVVIVVKYLKTEDVTYLSMMVHPDNTKQYNKVFKDWIDKQLKSWRKSLRKQEGHMDRESVLTRFEKLYPKAAEFYEDYELPEFDVVKAYLSDVLSDYKTYLVNTDVDAETEIDWDRYAMHILVGAEMLNRGFTVEKLATTYMPRYTVGATNADTIQQRCRFFGYKEDYVKSCRVFLPEISIENYMDYINHEEELRSTLENCDTLAAAERKILLSPKLKPTRLNVLPITVVNTKLKGMVELQAFDSKSLIESNNIVAEKFIQDNINNFNLKYEYSTLDRTHRGLKLSIDDAITFLSDFRFGSYKDVGRKAATIRYLRYLSELENGIRFVYFIEMAYNAPIRHRDFDAENLCLAKSTGIPAGPSSAENSTDYPGDSKIVGEDSITIQLYHFHLDNAPISYAHQAYTLAINYPEQLAINYCACEEANQEEDEDDEHDEN